MTPKEAADLVKVLTSLSAALSTNYFAIEQKGYEGELWLYRKHDEDAPRYPIHVRDGDFALDLT